MKIKSVGANQTEVAIDNFGVILVSYATPIAIVYKDNSANVDADWNEFSKTTTKHVKHFLLRHKVPTTAIAYSHHTKLNLQAIIDNGGLNKE